MRLLASLLASFGIALLAAAPARAELVLAVNEGVTYYVTPSEIREKYKDLADLLGKHLKTTVKVVPFRSSFEPSLIRYVIRYWLTDLTQDEWTDSEVRVHAFAALAREGMEIPIPRHEVFMNPASEVRRNAEARERETRVLLLRSLELFAPLTDEERLALASELKPSPFVVGDIATRQGEPADSLYILARGQVGIFHDSTDGTAPARQRLATLHGPAYFGEMGLLTGQPRGATVAAESDVLCYRLGKPGFEAILRSRPELAQALSQTVVARQAANDATLASLSAEARSRATGTRANDLVRRIQEFFGL